MIRTIEWSEAGVVMLDQRLLPGEEVYRTCGDYRAVADAILKLQSGDPVPRTVVDDDWLPWSHYREAACH